MKEYYDARAPEYDDWYYGQGQFAGRERPEVEERILRDGGRVLHSGRWFLAVAS